MGHVTITGEDRAEVENRVMQIREQLAVNGKL
jgi:hypothetical protein